MSLETNISAESLLQIPLIRAAVEDSRFKKSFRGIDQGWKDNGIIPVSVSGFNPYEMASFISKKSALSNWLKTPERSAREFNSSDDLVRQALFMAHDYLHAWAIAAIRELAESDFSFGTDSVHRGNIEDYVFCHLLTEAVATVGLDYWFLSQVQFNRVCPIGTRVRCLTIGYHSDYDEEIRKFNPDLRINDPRFFGFMAHFYCEGIFKGFAINDLDRSPVLMNWIDHEVMYGEKQREYARLWFSYLSKEGPASLKKRNAPLKIKKDWQTKLIASLGEMLWEKMKSPLSIIQSFDGARLWQYADHRSPDPRFSNLAYHDLKSMLKAAEKGPDREEKLNYLAYQYVSQYDFKKCALKIQNQVPELIRKQDFKSLERIFKSQSRVASSRDEPRHLMVLN